MIRKLLVGLLILVVLSPIVFLAPGLLVQKFSYGNETEIEASAAEIWGAITNPQECQTWIQGLDRMELLAGEHGKVGCRYRLHFSDKKEEQTPTTVDEHFTKVIENETLKFDLKTDVFTGETSINLVKNGRNTLVRSNNTVQGNNIFLRALFYWLKSHLKNQDKINYVALKKQVESRNITK